MLIVCVYSFDDKLHCVQHYTYAQSLCAGQILHLPLLLTTYGNWQAVEFSSYCNPPQ